MIKPSAPREASPEPAFPVPLTPKSLRALRARAHALKPVVWIAAGGPTEGVVRELDRALAVHELVKIHAAIDDREQRSQLLQSLCEQLGAEPVQTIGKMLVAFRPRPQSADTRSPAPSRRTKSGERGSNKAPARHARPSARSGKLAAAARRRLPNRSR
jgi:putative YhbY family RNA-binding protein